MKRNIGKRGTTQRKPFSEIHFDSTKLLANRDCGLILLLFHIHNDLALNTASYATRKANRSGALADFTFGQELSLMRLTCAQTREFLHVLPKVKRSEYLMSKVLEDKEATDASEYLSEFSPRGIHRSDFLKFKKIRDVLTFHYDTCELPRWYVEELTRRSETNPVEIFLLPNQREQHSERFTFIDDMNARMIRCNILESPGDSEESVEEAMRLTEGIVSKVKYLLAPILAGIISDYHKRPLDSKGSNDATCD